MLPAPLVFTGGYSHQGPFDNSTSAIEYQALNNKSQPEDDSLDIFSVVRQKAPGQEIRGPFHAYTSRTGGQSLTDMVLPPPVSESDAKGINAFF